MPWYVTNKLSIDANKYIVMLIGKPSQVHDDVDIKTRNDMWIEQAQSVIYFGIDIEGRLSWF